MTKHSALPVSGYKPQSDEKVQIVNANKELEESILRVLDELAGMPGIDQRWLAIGRAELEKGFMAVNRAIFQPGRVKLPEDTE